jgi:large subunit ribosomal protein L10
MASPDKEAAVAELAGEFRESNGAVLTEYRGLTVKQLQELRRSLGENARYAVAKNTLTKLAAKQADVELPEELLTGPTAIAFITGDVVEAAKGLESREVLLAKLAGGMKASIAGAAGLFNAPLGQAARLFAALQAKAEADPSVLAAAAPAAAEAPAPVDEVNEVGAEAAEEEAPAEEPTAEAEAPVDEAVDAPASDDAGSEG